MNVTTSTRRPTAVKVSIIIDKLLELEAHPPAARGAMKQSQEFEAWGVEHQKLAQDIQDVLIHYGGPIYHKNLIWMTNTPSRKGPVVRVAFGGVATELDWPPAPPPPVPPPPQPQPPPYPPPGVPEKIAGQFERSCNKAEH
jgi:hypothetical protein